MNQYLTLAHAIAAACVGQASLVIDAKPSTHRGWREGIRPGFKPDLSNAVATAPGRKGARDVDDAERRLHAAAETANKMEDAQRRREIEQLDKVVRAASLGSAAVVTAARRRLRDTDQQMETGARNLEIKLTGAELERRRKLEDVAAKARATGTARVEAAAQERKYREDRAEMDAEYRRNQARLASSRAEDAEVHHLVTASSSRPEESNQFAQDDPRQD